MELYRDFMDWHDRTMALGDPRMDVYPLMHSPIPSTLLAVLYVVLVLASMRWMKNRAPYDLRSLMVAYNLAMVVFSVWLVHEFCISGWLTGYRVIGCEPVDYSLSPKAVRMVRVCWWFYFSKFIEMLDTFFFIFRGKFELVTFLHVFHHAVLPPAWWWGVKFVPGGFGSFAAMLNSVVHAVMYLYYGLAAMGPKMQPYLWWKRYLTKFQMIQFVLMFVHGLQPYFMECDYPRQFTNAVMCFACIFFVLFANFYIQAYLKKPQQGARTREHQNGNKTSPSAAVTNGAHHRVTANGSNGSKNGHIANGSHGTKKVE